MLCDHLEGWNREGVREMQVGGDMGIYVYIKLIEFVIQQKLVKRENIYVIIYLEKNLEGIIGRVGGRRKKAGIWGYMYTYS